LVSSVAMEEALKHRFTADLSSPQERRNAINLLLEVALMVGETFPVVVLALLARCARCDVGSKDVDFVRGIAQLVINDAFVAEQKNSVDPRVSSYLLHWQIVHAELWRYSDAVPPAYSDLSDPLVFAGRGLGSLPFASWPPSPPLDAYHGAVVETNAAVLVINGGLDGQTPAWSAKQVFDTIVAPKKMYLEVPAGGHRQIIQEKCAESAATAFLRAEVLPEDGTSQEDILPSTSCRGSPDFGLPGLWS